MNTFYIYSESELELGSEQVVVPHLLHQHLITNPNAIKGNPKLLKQPQLQNTIIKLYLIIAMMI